MSIRDIFPRKRIKTKLFRLAEAIHLRLFGHEMSETMRTFLGHLSLSFFGGIIAAGMMFVVNILAGRWLGPEEYGKYNAILSFATVMATLYLFGADVSGVRYLSDRKHADSSKEIFTTLFLWVVGAAGFVILSLLLFQRFFVETFSISPKFLFLGGVLALVLAFKNLLNGFLRAFQKYREQNSYRILDAISVLVCFLVLCLLYGYRFATSYAYSMMAGGFLFIALTVFLLRHYFSKFDLSILKKIFKEYNKYVLISSLIGMAIASDKLLIGKFIGLKVLGVYSAYYAASHLIVAEFGGIFMNVFWPAAIRNAEAMEPVVKKVMRIFVTYSPVWVLLIALNTWVFLLFFGKDYPLRFDYLILFSINTFLGFLFSLFISFLNIDTIRRAIIFSGIFVVVSISALVAFKDVGIYIGVQIAVQIVLIYRMRVSLVR